MQYILAMFFLLLSIAFKIAGGLWNIATVLLISPFVLAGMAYDWWSKRHEQEEHLKMLGIMKEDDYLVPYFANG